MYMLTDLKTIILKELAKAITENGKSRTCGAGQQAEGLGRGDVAVPDKRQYVADFPVAQGKLVFHATQAFN